MAGGAGVKGGGALDVEGLAAAPRRGIPSQWSCRGTPWGLNGEGVWGWGCPFSCRCRVAPPSWVECWKDPDPDGVGAGSPPPPPPPSPPPPLSPPPPPPPPPPPRGWGGVPIQPRCGARSACAAAAVALVAPAMIHYKPQTQVAVGTVPMRVGARGAGGWAALPCPPCSQRKHAVAVCRARVALRVRVELLSADMRRPTAPY